MPKRIEADLSGKTAIVTGANTGIGKEIAVNLAGLGATVVLACRSRERGQAALDEIAARTGKRSLELALVDVSSQASIREFAQGFRASHPRLDVLVNNAGVWSQEERRLSVDGIELTFATNVLGYFLLTELLLDRLRASAPSRIVNVASEFARGLDLDDLQYERRKYSGPAAYAQSKQANRMWNVVLAERLAGSGVTVNVCHPGMVSTDLGRDFPGILGWIARFGVRLFGRTVEKGADVATWLAASPEVEGATGGFYVDRKKVRCRFDDRAANQRLWEICERMTGVHA